MAMPKPGAGPMDTITACGSAIGNLQRLILSAETCTLLQTKAMLDRIQSNNDMGESDEDFWRNVDNLLSLRRQQMQALTMLRAALKDELT